MQRAECWSRWFCGNSLVILFAGRVPKIYAPGQEHSRPDFQADSMARRITPLENAWTWVQSRVFGDFLEPADEQGVCGVAVVSR
jgi:hypothetical protein